MQLADHFDVLLRDTVNLSQFRLDTLSDRVDSVYTALCADADIGDMINEKRPQGSWAHRTIIDPVGDREFDADFMLMMDERTDWTPRDYLREVNSALGRHHKYKDMTHERKTRCVRLVYANSCHLDIVPSITRGDQHFIPNWETDEWERTDPDGFTAWMKERDQRAGGNLRRVIRLVKFLRDHRGSFTGTRSILITTLLGEQVTVLQSLIDPGHYGNVPTALVHIVEDLDEFMQARPTKPSVPDPSGSGLNFDHRWTQETYGYFRDRIHAHAAEMREAYDCTDKTKSVELWQAIFGDGFKAPADKVDSGPFKTAAPVVSSGLSGRAG